MLSGNIGEWSEIYVFFKLLADGKLYAADANLNKMNQIFYPILKILRKENDIPIEYNSGQTIVVKNSFTGKELIRISIDDFIEQTGKLFSLLKEKPKGSFPIPEIETFLKNVKVSKLKATSDKTRDITIVVHDLNTGMTPELGFSIKSQLGSPSTLLNAGKTTNFTFKIKDLKLSEEEITQINNINPSSGKIQARIEEIVQRGGKLVYSRMDRHNFYLNLILIDSLMPELLSEYLIIYYSGGGSRIEDLTKSIRSNNPFDFDIQFGHPFYEYRIKKFLTDTALGMTPSALWKGIFDATGGYIIVKEDGDVLCYHLYNMNEFQDYLFKNTKLETASSNRHKFGKIYVGKEGDLEFKLNLQIRFIK